MPSVNGLTTTFPPDEASSFAFAALLGGVLTTDDSKSDDELVAMAKGWTIVGRDRCRCTV
jgi:hypothetical protein